MNSFICKIIFKFSNDAKIEPLLAWKRATWVQGNISSYSSYIACSFFVLLCAFVMNDDVFLRFNKPINCYYCVSVLVVVFPM